MDNYNNGPYHVVYCRSSHEEDESFPRGQSSACAPYPPLQATQKHRQQQLEEKRLQTQVRTRGHRCQRILAALDGNKEF